MVSAARTARNKINVAAYIGKGIITPGAGGGVPPVGPTLQALTSSVSSTTVGVPLNATISGKTSGSTLSLTGAGAAGLSVSGSMVSGTPTAIGDISVIEILAGATGSPKTSGPLISVSAAAATVPAAMAAPTLTAGDGQITVARAAAPTDGGSPITSYDARRSTDGTNWTTTVGVSASQAVTGLTNGTPYQVQTRAVNAVGPGAWSPSATATPVAAGQALTISGSPGNAKVGDNPTFSPAISGGAAPYTLSLASGTLPPGRAVNGAAKTVTGAYTTAGNFAYVLRATDSVGATADLSVSLVVSAASAVTKLPPNPRFAVMGDSIFAGSDTRNLTEVIATVSRSRMQAGIGARLAQGGRTMQDMLNEILLGGGTQMGAATAQKLDVLIFNGGTNDLAPGSGGTPRTLDEMKADHQSIVDLAKASGVKVVARSTIPRTKTVDDSTSKRQMFNAWLRTRTDIVLADVENTFDPNDLVFANPDGIHATINGVIHSYAAVIVAALEPYFDTAFDATAADPANLDADCRITGTGGTIGTGIASDSTVANGWTAANASTATVRVDTIEGRMRVTASGNASAIANITLQNSIPISGNFTPGKNIRATQKARIARASQDAGPIGVRLLTGALGTFGGFLSTTYETATGPLTTILDGVMQMIPKRWSGGGSPSVLETITVSVAAGAVDFVLDIGPGNALFSEPVAYCPPDLVPGRAVPIVVASASSGNTTNAVEFGAWYGGGYTFTFQHFKNGAAISGATGRTYVQPTSGAAGDYFCDATCTNAMGSKTYRTATITVA